jgi:hypothetical protein
MAYDIENLISLGGNAKRGKKPSIYFYWDEDGDTLTSAGFFVNSALAVGDQICAISADYTAQVWYRVSAVSSGKATVVALTSLDPAEA